VGARVVIYNLFYISDMGGVEVEIKPYYEEDGITLY